MDTHFTPRHCPSQQGKDSVRLWMKEASPAQPFPSTASKTGFSVGKVIHRCRKTLQSSFTSNNETFGAYYSRPGLRQVMRVVDQMASILLPLESSFSTQFTLLHAQNAGIRGEDGGHSPGCLRSRVNRRDDDGNRQRRKDSGESAFHGESGEVGSRRSLGGGRILKHRRIDSVFAQ